MPPSRGCGRFWRWRTAFRATDTFSRLFAKLDPAGLQKALLRLAQDWADRVVRMHPDKRSVRRKLIRARRDDDFLLDMIRRIRKNE